MKILGLITARGGSKRIPGKNIRLLGGRPLIVWSIEVTKGITEICDTLVSTDDSTIAEVARTAGAVVPWLRPKELGTDTATSADVCLHALGCYETENGPVDGLLLLQPTSPFRSRETLLKGIELFRRQGRRPVLGVSLAESHPMWCFKIDGETMRPFIDDSGLSLRSQDLTPAYVDTGALYLIAPERLRTTRSFYSSDMLPLILEKREEGLDIDTEWDWELAEAMLRSRIAPEEQISE